MFNVLTQRRGVLNVLIMLVGIFNPPISLVPRLSVRGMACGGGGKKKSLVSTVHACVEIHIIRCTCKLAVFLHVHFVSVTQ